MSAAAVNAATYNVTTTNDENDGGATPCTDTPADCSLREAVIEANNAAGTEIINLPAGTYTLTVIGDGEDDDALTGDLDLNTDITINGAGQSSTIIDGNGSVISERPLQTFGGINITLADLTVTGGEQNGDGGGIDANGNTGSVTLTDVTFDNNVANGTSGNGGAISSGTNKTITITRATFSNNTGYTKGGAIYAPNGTTLTVIDSNFFSNSLTRTDGNTNGGAIFNKGLFTVTGSLFSGNSAFNRGGAIASFCSGVTSTITNSTFVGNSITGTWANSGGGAISSACTLGTTATDDIQISHSTIVNNIGTSAEVSAGLYAQGGPSSEEATILVRNSIVANNLAGASNANCYTRNANSVISTNNYNIDDGTTCGFVLGNDQESTDPLLDTDGQEDNGGNTETVDLQASSPAVDAGVCTDNGAITITDDQRDYTRPDNSVCDIGAVERDQANPVVTRTGGSPVTHECAESYTDLGGTATDNFHPDPAVSIDTSNLDVDTVGSYTVDIIAVDYDDNTDTVQRSVDVTDTTDPAVSVIGATSVSVNRGATYSDAGATTTDACDANPAVSTTNPVDTSVSGDYTVTYTATDASNNSDTGTRTVTVLENVYPAITITGDSSIIVKQNVVYTDDGATASDTEDGDITSSIVTTNSVDTSVVGVYTVTYSVTDSYSGTATTTRTVEVVSRGKAIKATPLTNNRVKIKYTDGSTQKFKVFNKGTKKPLVKIYTNGRYFVVINKTGTKIKSVHVALGTVVSSKKLRKKSQDKTKTKVLNFYAKKTDNDVLAVTRKGKVFKTTHFTLTKNGVLKGKDTKNFDSDYNKDSYKIKKKNKLVKITKKTGGLITEYTVTEKGNLK